MVPYPAVRKENGPHWRTNLMVSKSFMTWAFYHHRVTISSPMSRRTLRTFGLRVAFGALRPKPRHPSQRIHDESVPNGLGFSGPFELDRENSRLDLGL